MRVIALVVLMMVGGVVQADGLDEMRDKAKLYYQAANSLASDSAKCLRMMKSEGTSMILEEPCQNTNSYMKNNPMREAVLDLMGRIAELSDREAEAALRDMVVGDFIENYSTGFQNFRLMAQLM